jgi:hypothetical protein
MQVIVDLAPDVSFLEMVGGEAERTDDDEEEKTMPELEAPP